MLAKFFRVSHNTQMLGIIYAYLMIFIFDKDSFEIFLNQKIKKNLKIDYEEEVEEKQFKTRKKKLDQ